MTDPDLAQMLRDLADAGWKPLLYAETDLAGHVKEWVCYPQGNVRYWQSFRAPDPVGAVRKLWAHARVHPNEPPLLWRDTPAPSDDFGRCALCGGALPPGWKPPHQCPPSPVTSNAAARPTIDYGRSVFLGLFGGGRRWR